MDPYTILKEQAQQALDRNDIQGAIALLQALQAVSGTIPPPPTEMKVGERKLVYTGPPAEDPVIPPEEQPRATDFDLDRLAQMDEKDYKLHRK